MTVMVKCPFCSDKFDFGKHIERREIELDEPLILTVVTCPECGGEYVNQIDNAITMKVLERQYNTGRIIGRALYLQNKRLENKMTVKQSRLSLELNYLREELVKRYNNRIYQFGDENKKLEFMSPSMKILG